MAETWYGRAFIRTYYAISPTLVKWFGHTNWFKKMWKGKLDRMVSDLNAKGVQDTPYQDKTGNRLGLIPKKHVSPQQGLLQKKILNS